MCCAATVILPVCEPLSIGWYTDMMTIRFVSFPWNAWHTHHPHLSRTCFFTRLVRAPVVIIIVPPGLCVFSNGIGVVPITTLCLSQCCLAVSYIMVHTAAWVESSLCSCPLNMSAWTSFMQRQTVSNLPLFVQCYPVQIDAVHSCDVLCSFSDYVSPRLV
jgi:hypothetical protein